MGFISFNSRNTVSLTRAGYHQFFLEYMPTERHLSGAVHGLFWVREFFSSWTTKGVQTTTAVEETYILTSQLRGLQIPPLQPEDEVLIFTAQTESKIHELPDGLAATMEASGIPSTPVLSESKCLGNTCGQHGN